MKSSHFFALAVLLSYTGAASAAWTRLPYEESHPINLAAKAIPGTKIIASTGIDTPDALLADDTVSSAHIASGKNEVTVQLVNQQLLNLVSFVNDSAEGKVTCSSSPDQKNWTVVGHQIFVASDRLVSVSFANVQSKYVTLSIETVKGGAIRNLGIYGTSEAKDFHLQPSPGGGSPVNFASSPGGAHPIYAFPTPNNVGEMDFRYNVFKFPKTGDKYRILVYDLGKPRSIKEFSAAYSQRPVRLEVFAFTELPEKKDWRGKMTLDPEIFNSTKPVAIGEDPRGVGHLKVSPAKPIVAQYVALRFEPNYLRSATGGTFEATPWGDLAVLTLGSAGALLEGLNLLPQEHLTAAGDDGDFQVSGVGLGSTGSYSCPPGGGSGTGSDGQGGSNNNDQNNGNNNTGAAIYGTPGSPPAGSGGAPGSPTGGTGSGTGATGTTAPVDVTVGAAGGGGTGGTTNTSGGGSTNPSSTTTGNP